MRWIRLTVEVFDGVDSREPDVQARTSRALPADDQGATTAVGSAIASVVESLHSLDPETLPSPLETLARALAGLDDDTGGDPAYAELRQLRRLARAVAAGYKAEEPPQDATTPTG